MGRILVILVLIVTISCSKDQIDQAPYFFDLMEIPLGFPAIEEPEENMFSNDRWTLGKRLFFDNDLSIDRSISCASCHNPALAFSDELPLSLGVEGRLGTRNAPGLANVAYHPYLTREGGLPTLEMQVLVPIQEHNEFDFNIIDIVERLEMDSVYQEMSLQAYDRALDAFVITRALACFERSLISGYSAFDQYMYYDKPAALSGAAIRGMNLFNSPKTNCSECHGGFNFTNYAFENNGLYEAYEDDGRFRLTGIESDRALFKVPSLRNIELTGPYMHDGSMETLEEVIEHYRSGGKNHPNKSEGIKPLLISDNEANDLEEFLKALTDHCFVSNPLFQE